MSNKDMPVYPVSGNDAEQCQGLTKLEAFTMAAMQGILANPSVKDCFPKIVADIAADYAEAALAELEKRETKA